VVGVGGGREEEAARALLEIEPLVVDRERDFSFIPLLPILETLARHKPATFITTQLQYNLWH